MKYRNRFVFAIATAVSVVSVSSLSAATLSIDNFESYSNGQPIAIAGPPDNADAATYPWVRSGYAVEDNLYATSRSAYDGNFGSEIPVDINNPADITTNNGRPTSATVERRYAAPVNFTAYAGGTATVMSQSYTANISGTTSDTALQLVISDGNTTYLSNVPLDESGTYSSFTFAIDNADMFDADDESTPETLAQVLADTTDIGFRLSSPTGVETSETIDFDDFAVTTAATPVPEPASAAVLIIGAVAAGVRRRSTV